MRTSGAKTKPCSIRSMIIVPVDTPGVEILLDLPGMPAMHLPPLKPGEHVAVADLHWSPPCR